LTGRRRAWTRALLVTGVIVVADQVTKMLARDALAPGEQDPILPALKLVHVRNEGVAFGALAGGGAIVVALVAFALTALLLYFATHADRPLAWLPTGMLLGGAVGNIIDRLRDGWVTDFLKLPGWPAFNVADISITFGVIALLLVLERGERRDADPGRAA
jgi:signal peptidase II